ncbi:ABC transporter permease subunit [Mesorhizobium escarrei]|uniref:ABC transporter, permease n=1 Tax=Mesorhizobium escarrei TaxID=666018 RepID=A0ABN8K4C7_9HYPH|nr:ABC transporter permease subunit [Mesorhizobium escarrei]CAH2405105.1 ABC transporter, permease [Mesorhizobium escarrei]
MKTLQKLGRRPIVLTAPAFVLLIAVLGIPMVQLLLTSLNAPAFSLSNYQGFFEQTSNVRVLFQTVKISVVTTAICLIIGYPTAYLIVSASKHVRIALIVLVLIPWLTSGLVRTYAWVVILGDHGLINNLLLNLGLISSPVPLIYNRLAVYIGMVHIMLPMMILPLLSVMQGIDTSLLAAARSMGAGPFLAFWRVFLPLSLPGIRSGSLLVFVVCLGFYVTPQALGGLGDAMLSTFIASQVASSFNLAPTAAAAFILLGIALVVLSIFGLDVSGSQGRAARATRKSLPSPLPSFAALTRFLKDLAAPYRAKRWTAQLYSARGDSRLSSIVGAVFVTLVMAYLLFPGLIVVMMSFSGGPALEFPPSSLSLKWYRAFLGDPSWTGAFWNSIQIAVTVAILSTILGTLAAYGFNRTSRRVRSVLTMAILAPITFPAIVVGIATYFGLLKLGLLGTRSGLVLAHSTGAITSVVVIVLATLANFDQRLERAAQSMRAAPIQVFMRVTLPLILPGIIGGAVFAFIGSFDEVIITSLVSGFDMQTLPLKMLENIRQEIDPTIAAVGSLLTLMPLLWLMILYATWWWSKSRLQQLSAKPPA